MTAGNERRQELGDFLRSRRMRIQPDQVGLTAGKRRRTPGLRREELARLADVGLTWYTWLEQGRDITVSAQVLDRLSDALRLDNGERVHLHLLARQETPILLSPPDDSVPEGLRVLLDALPNSPALLLSRHWDVLAWNAASLPYFGDWQERAATVGACERNFIWHLFCSGRAGREVFADWSTTAQRFLAHFRADTGCLIGDAHLSELLGCVREASPEFREWWTRHDICGKALARVTLNQPEHGPREYHTATLQVCAEPHRRLLTFAPANAVGSSMV